MRAIIHWRLLPESLFTDGALLGTESNSKQCFYSVKAVCRVASKTKAQRSPGEVRFCSFIHSLGRQCCTVFLLWQEFSESTGGKKHDYWTRSAESPHFLREKFSKGHSAHSRTNFHWSALFTVVYAPGVLPRIPVINQPQTESNIKNNLKKINEKRFLTNTA